MKKSLILSLFIFLFTAFAGITYAQEAGITVSPAIIEDRVDPGDVFSGSIRVTNKEDSTRTFYISARDISHLSETGQPVFADFGEKTGYELSQWVSVPFESVDILPNDSREVPFEIRVPENASPGGHFGGIFFSVEAPRLRSLGAGIGYSVGTIVNLRISGSVRENADIRKFSTDKLIYSNPNVSFEVEVENLGNVLLRPRGSLIIQDMFGREISTIRVNDTGAALLPESRRIYEAVWNGNKGIFFGRYTALVALVYGEDDRRTISSVATFWILPLKVLLFSTLGALLFILTIYMVIRFYVKRKLKEMYDLSQQQTGAVTGSQLSMRKQMSPPPIKTPFPKLAVVTIALLIFTLFFLAMLFIFFA